MKKLSLFIAATWMFCISIQAQDQPMQVLVAKLDKARAISDYRQLAGEFEALALRQKTGWLPYYYAAFCNARVGWLYQQDGEKIEPFADQGEKDINKAVSLLDTAVQKKELSEVYCVLSMVNRARVFINPMSYGRQYGPAAYRYTQMALMANSNNPRANYLAGWEKFSTPKLWGGDKKKAKELLELAKQQLEAAPPDGIDPHWGIIEVDEILKQLK